MSRLSKITAAGFVAAVLLHGAASRAELVENDPMIEGAKMCTQYLPRHEREYGIPMHLLAAIASTESGRYHEGLGLRLPWPWTINAEGQGYFFQTKAEAIAAVQRLQARGMKSIDVGCMQVNLMHHPNAFASLDQAFDPAYNVAYAASFLHENFESLKTWRAATAAYHSRTPVYGSQYVAQVFDAWQHILTKVAQAKSGTLALVRDKWDMPRFSHSTDVDHQSVKEARESGHSAHAARPRPQLTASRENGVMVIRPRTNPVPAEKTTEVAMADTGDSPLIGATPIVPVQPASTGQFSPPRAKIIHVGSGAVKMGSNTSISVTKAPQFVFDN